MIPAARLLRRSLVRCLPVLLGFAGWAQAMAADDPPGRVARLNDGEGTVVYAPAGDNEWTDANYNRPLTRGDRLWTDKGSRAEIQVGSGAVRMDGQTHLEITTLDDQSAQLSLTQGNLYVHVRDLPDGENFEVDTPNLAFRAAYPGDYRIDVDALRGTTRVTIHSGTGAVYGETGEAIPLGGGQQIMFRARDLNKVNTQESPPQDGFDRWAAERNRHEDQSPSARYVPREVVGYQQLDAHGQWQRDAALGWIWLPIVKGADWAPYRAGHWEWIEPWGWTWMDDAPWGFAPFHYGRWTQVNSRWAWVPGRLGPHPVYAPALVAFVGGSSKSSVAWFPLAPEEPFQPGYAVSPLYVSNVNRNIVLTANPDYRYQRKPEALTAIAADDFQRGKPLRAGWLRVAANMITQAQVVPPPPMPGRGAIADHARPVQQARVAPPAAADARQVVANAAPARVASAPVRAASQQPAQAAAPAQPKTALAPQPAASAQARAASKPAQVAATQPVQPKAVAKAAAAPAQAQPQPAAPVRAAAQRAPEQEQQRRVQAARADQARRQEQARREQKAAVIAQARRAEQAKAEKYRDQARRAEQAKREQALARRTEQARHEEQLRREQQAKREQLLARRAEQAKRDAVAKREEQQRREVHAQLVEQARRAADRDAQALREQRAQREEQARREEQSRREEQARRDAQEREVAQRAAQLRQQQALIEQWRRDHQVLDPQRERVRQRPDLRSMASPTS